MKEKQKSLRVRKVSETMQVANLFGEVPVEVVVPVTVKVAKPKKATDPRHISFKELIFRCYRFLNGDDDPPWDATEAKQLSRLLGAMPKLDEAKFHRCLINYARSHGTNPPDRPRMFIPKLISYASGPLDRFGRPITGPRPVQTESPREKLRKQLADSARAEK